MDSSLKQRLVGATVLVALAVIFLPMLVKGPAPGSGVSDVSLDIPAEPKNDAAIKTVDLPLMPAAGVPKGGVVGMPADAPDEDAATAAGTGAFPTIAAGDYVVSFGSYATAADSGQVVAALQKAGLPAFSEAIKANGRDVQRVRIGPFADRAVAESARLASGKVNAGVDAKVVVLDADPTAPLTASTAAASAGKAVAAPAPVPATASAKPEPLPPVAKPVPPPAVAVKPIEPTTAPVAKPVATTMPATPPVVAPAAAAVPKPAPVAKPAADTSKTGFAVQVGAFAAAADANTLRDKLRGAGFTAFTDTVTTDKGVLTRVRVGPTMNRTEADALQASVKAKLGLNGMVRPHP